MSDEQNTTVELTEQERKYLARVIEQRIDAIRQLSVTGKASDFHVALLAKLQPQRKEPPMKE